jgi:RNA polymerase sigma factor FliA
MYVAEQCNNSFQQLVEKHTVLVKRIAHHLMARLPDSVQVDDLIQSGMIGLIEAAKNYDNSKGAAFETYAGIRIRGSMLDEVRRGDWVPRSVHRNSRRIAAAIREVEVRESREPTDAEVAAELEVTVDEYFVLLKDCRSSKLFSFEEVLENNNGTESIEVNLHESAKPTPFEQVQGNYLQENLVKAIKLLPEREQLVLSLYYDEELNLKEIGEVLGVSESRVSQIHSQAAIRLKVKLQHWIS